MARKRGIDEIKQIKAKVNKIKSENLKMIGVRKKI